MQLQARLRWGREDVLGEGGLPQSIPGVSGCTTGWWAEGVWEDVPTQASARPSSRRKPLRGPCLRGGLPWTLQSLVLGPAPF